jgi:heme-degrading monooxygenase HmoA
MRSTRVALYDIKSGTFDEIVSKAEAGMVPLFQHSDGFVSYGVAQIDETAFVSLSTWDTRAQADAATTKAAEWVKANGMDQFTLRRAYVGDLAIDAGILAPA